MMKIRGMELNMRTYSMGKGANTFAVLTYTLNGMPLIYTGQRSGFSIVVLDFSKRYSSQLAR